MTVELVKKKGFWCNPRHLVALLDSGTDEVVGCGRALLAEMGFVGTIGQIKRKIKVGKL